MSIDIRVSPSGDRGMVIELGNEISEKINRRVLALCRVINLLDIDGVIELIPTYTTLMVIYDPLKLGYDELLERVESAAGDLEEDVESEKEVVHIPVLYGGEYGMDLEAVAEHCGLSREKVIEIHSSVDYFVYMIGFAPGFPYLGGMPKDIAAPRLKQPRTSIPAGSVGIAGEQTGIYPLKSPGGWQIIGRTPLKLFSKEEGGLLKAGQYIRFYEIDEDEYMRIERELSRGTYKVKTVFMEEVK